MDATLPKNILCLFLQALLIWMQHNFWLAKLYALANHKLCYIQRLINIEKSVEQDKERSEDSWWIQTLVFYFRCETGSQSIALGLASNIQ